MKYSFAICITMLLCCCRSTSNLPNASDAADAKEPVKTTVQSQKTIELDEVVITGYGTQSQRKVRSKPIANCWPLAQAGTGFNKDEDFNTEDYKGIEENRFKEVAQNPLSTFSIDVDGASYSNVRRFLNSGQLPPAGSVRVEELINYFHYNYPQPKEKDLFSVNTEIHACPWNAKHKLAMIGLQGQKIQPQNLPPSNLVFLIDVSGSMEDEDKLPLVKSSMKLLVDQLREIDRVAIVVYAGNAGLVLESTNGTQKMKIKTAIDNLEAGGSTAGGEGIRLAYEVAKQHMRTGTNSRIILCTDGDFNIGLSSDAEMEKLIEQERASGIFLTVLGYGMGNYKDSKMQILAGKGNGNAAYIDNLSEAKKVLVNEAGGTLFTIAKDVKLQVEFNPKFVKGYRLIGYENRMLNKEDFNNDKKDAGEIGNGHTVTALYELIPAGVEDGFIEQTDALKYQRTNSVPGDLSSSETMNIKVRHKTPDGTKSILSEYPVVESGASTISDNFLLASSVAQYGMLLSNSEFKQNSTFQNALQTARTSLADDPEGYRKEFIGLIVKAEELTRKNDVSKK